MHGTNKTKSQDYINKFKYEINKIIKQKISR